MEIRYDNSKLRKACNDSKEATKQWGHRMAEMLARRQNELRAASVLSDLDFFDPCRLHELTGNLGGKFSVDLVHPYRLLFKPNDPVPYKMDGGIDRGKITEIVILGVDDTHDRKSRKLRKKK
jgi:proteic killer suppression protein